MISRIVPSIATPEHCSFSFAQTLGDKSKFLASINGVQWLPNAGPILRVGSILSDRLIPAANRLILSPGRIRHYRLHPGGARTRYDRSSARGLGLRQC